MQRYFEMHNIAELGDADQLELIRACISLGFWPNETPEVVRRIFRMSSNFDGRFYYFVVGARICAAAIIVGPPEVVGPSPVVESDKCFLWFKLVRGTMKLRDALEALIPLIPQACQRLLLDHSHLDTEDVQSLGVFGLIDLGLIRKVPWAEGKLYYALPWPMLRVSE